MGRHGGGSRSGGGSRGGSRSSGGSRSGGSGARTSSKPFSGCYNRSYYDKRGRYHSFYTSDRNFGTKSGWNSGIIIALAFITIHMLMMMGGFLGSCIEFGGKVDGDTSRIFIEDRVDLLTEAEEKEILLLFNEVYEKSGMPVTLYTDDFAWQDYYYSLEIYSEELYYNLGLEEDAMLILFTTETNNGFFDWQYDMYCGDDTIKCLSDEEFDTLLSKFQKAMAGQNLKDALDYAWNAVMDDIGAVNIYWSQLPVLVGLALFYGVFYAVILYGNRKSNEAYKYFKKNPEKLSMSPMTTIYRTCPSCGASNTEGGYNCKYCGSLLKIKEGNTQYVQSTEEENFMQ